MLSPLKLPEGVLKRLQGLMVERQKIDVRMQDIVQTVLEVMGLDGGYDIDMVTGEIKRPAANKQSIGAVMGAVDGQRDAGI